ncbi:MAG: YicC family protein [Methylohalobius sp.]|nr:YicC family protein [Methylohalobius sp.]
MTAFAEHQSQTQLWTARWEIRATNARYLDLTVRLPENLRSLEPDIRHILGQYVSRGKLECSLRVEPAPGAQLAFELNRPLTNALIRALGELESWLKVPASVSLLDLARWPGVLQEPKQDLQSLREMVLSGLKTALEQLVAARRQEGHKLAEFLSQRCGKVREQVLKARELLPVALNALKAKLTSKIEEIATKPDYERLEQELVYLAQKLDISEELDRLTTHLAEAERLLEQDVPIGRRLDFLCQEMNREANTLAAKAASTDLIQCAIEIKVLVEQMREQVQNLE